MTLRIAVPNKGRLAEDAVDILRTVSIRVPHQPTRNLVASAHGGLVQVLYARAQDIPEFVELGAADVGITGLDLVEESGCRVERLHDFDFGRCKLVIAAPEASPITRTEEIPAKARVATVYPRLVRRYFEERGQDVAVVSVGGATEITPSIGVADVIADLTQTGATLRQNHLSMLDIVMESWAVLVGCSASLERKRDQIDDLVGAFRSVQAAARKRYLMANLDRSKLEEVARLLPGLSGPTVVPLAAENKVAVHAVVEEDALNAVVAQLSKCGATGILVLPIERLIP